MPYKDKNSISAKISNYKKDRKYKEIHREEINKKQRDRIKVDEEYRLKMIAKVKRHYDKNRDAILEYRKKTKLHKYGINFEQYTKIAKAQDYVCAICSGVDKSGYRLSVDHNHETGKIRGLLCQKCNHAIGLFKDDVQLLIKAIEYLEING